MSTASRLVFAFCVAALLSPNASLFAHEGHDHDHDHGHTHNPVDYSFNPNHANEGAPEPDDEGFYWWKGNLHTHTLWSDGDQYPEVVTDWYHEHGYHFLALSDHNVLSRGERWIDPTESVHARRGGGMEGFEFYRERFGEHWIETREDAEGNLEVRLKPLNEFRHLFEAPGRFLMIEGEEITDHRSVHVNATNLVEFIEPQGGDTVEQTIQRNVDAVYEQREETGQAMFPHLNHPNFQWAVRAEDMMPVESLRFFEVYNGHRSVHNYGDETHVGLERMWDIVLSQRLGGHDLDVVYGLAVDDAHNYETSATQTAQPGRGWVMVRSRFLTPEHLIEAMEAGEFYATTGVELRSVDASGSALEVEVEPEDGVNYTIQFIGTPRDYDASSEPRLDAEGEELNVTRRYSDEIGQVLDEVEGAEARYELTGEELYVRAVVLSDKPKENGFAEDEMEQAWVQPVVPGE